MTTTTAESKVKFLQNGVRSSSGTFHPCYYSLTTLIDGRVAVTLYAKSILKGLPAEMKPENDSDMQTDYFENDRVRFFEGSTEFAQLKQLIEIKERADQARWLKRQHAKANANYRKLINPELIGGAR
jgi:hypothetical protein